MTVAMAARASAMSRVCTPCNSAVCNASRSGFKCRQSLFAQVPRNRVLRPLRKVRSLVVKNAKEDDVANRMTATDAMKLLGVKEDASFDDILRAKSKLIASCADNKDECLEIESAYDILLMQSLQKRRAGEVASKDIRFADVTPQPLIPKEVSAKLPKWLKESVLTPVSVGNQSPSQGDLAVQSVLYLSLAIWTAAAGMGMSDRAIETGQDQPSIQLIMAFGFALAFMRRRKLKPGRSLALAVGAVAAGELVGLLLESWLHIEIVPLMGLSSPGAFTGEFAILALYAACTLLA